MEFLFNSSGKHIANLVNGQLHAPTGKNIGHFLPSEEIFIDMSGHYLGEIVHKNRLMYNLSSSYRSMNFGRYGDYGNVGNYGSIGTIGGYRNVEL